MKYFKGDATEIKMQAIFEPINAVIESGKDLFLAEAYQTYPLGDLIHTEDRSPLSNAIIQDIFRQSFKEIFDAFVVAGTFESYLTVFRKIFGDTVDVDFVVPAPGKLSITIIADGLELSNFITREIVSNAYVYDTIVDDVGDNIVFQTIKGFQTQYELELMLNEMVPAGIFTDIDLTVS